jgi:hypothetical protein
MRAEWGSNRIIPQGAQQESKGICCGKVSLFLIFKINAPFIVSA